MPAPSSSSSVEGPVRVAAALLVLYGLLVLLNATVLQVAAGWQDVPDYARAVVRLLGMGLLAWGLMHRRRWAWWLSVGLASFWALMGGLAVGFLSLSDGWEALPHPTFSVGFMIVSLGLLLGAIRLLLSASTRAVFNAA